MSNESKVYQGLNSLRKEFCAFRSEHNVGDIYSYMKNINYFFDKDDKPIDRMESLMCLIASLTSDEYGYHCVAVPVNGKKKVISVLMNRKYDMRKYVYYKSERLCPDERYEFCFCDKLSSPCCQYRYVSKYIIRHGVKHYVIDCSLSIFKEKESIIKFCNALIGLFNDGEFRYDGIGKLELPDFDSTEPFHIEDSEPLESDSTKYDRYLMDGEWRKKEKVKTGGRTVKFDVEEEKLRILNKKLEFYKEVAFSIIMFLTMLSGVFFLVFAVIKLLS